MHLVYTFCMEQEITREWDGLAYQRARKAVGMTRRTVAALMLVTETTIFRWESGAQTPHIIFQRALWAVLEPTNRQVAR